MIADSLAFDGLYAVAGIAAACGLFPQSSLLATKLPDPSCNSSIGSESVPANELGGAANDGPIARKIKFFGAVPLIISPPIRTLSPVPTNPRVEMLDSRVVTESSS